MLALTVGVLVAGCGDSKITKSEFRRQLQSVTAGPDKPTDSLADCIYNRISDDPDLLVAAVKPDEPDTKNAAKLAAATTACWTETDGGTRATPGSDNSPTTALENALRPGG